MMNEQLSDLERSQRFTKRFVIGFAIVEAILIGFAIFSRYFQGRIQ
jgi:hypothetical protein